MTKLANIGNRKIPVRIGNGVTEVRFSAGVHGKKERGTYRFWTCVGEDDDGPFTIYGRARKTLDAGDRFARMAWKKTVKNPYAHRVVYRRMYRVVNDNAHYIRPSTYREVSNWAASHKQDMTFANKTIIACGKKRRLK